MKIVYIYDAIARIGGTEKILVDKINYLADCYKQEIYLLTTCQGNHQLAFPLSEHVKHIDLSIRTHTLYQYPLLKRLWIGRKMDKELKTRLNDIANRINPDIIISTSYYAADIACRIRHKAVKIVESHSVRGYDESKSKKIASLYKKWKTAKYYKAIERHSDIIISLTSGDAKRWKAGNVKVIPNIVDINPQAYSQQTNRIALFTGRISKIKSLDRMLRAWKIVVSKHPDWTLKIVGDGDDKDALRQQCKQLGIEKNVIFAPSTKNVAKEYADSSIFLLTSISEGLPLVLIEAMQCGVPCVSFDCPYGPADIIDNGTNGYLVENGNIEKFADSVMKLICNDESRKQMGLAAIEKAKKYLPGNIMPQWMALFNKLKDNN